MQSLSPRKPSWSLIAVDFLSSFIGQFVLQFLFNAILFFTVRLQSFYSARETRFEDENLPNFQNTVLFVFGNFVYLFFSWVLSIGRPFRKSMSSNCKSSDQRS